MLSSEEGKKDTSKTDGRMIRGWEERKGSERGRPLARILKVAIQNVL